MGDGDKDLVEPAEGIEEVADKDALESSADITGEIGGEEEVESLAHIDSGPEVEIVAVSDKDLADEKPKSKPKPKPKGRGRGKAAAASDDDEEDESQTEFLGSEDLGGKTSLLPTT